MGISVTVQSVGQGDGVSGPSPGKGGESNRQKLRPL